MEQWKRPRPKEAQEYPWHRKRIEAWLREGNTLEGIAAGVSEILLGLLSRDMKRQARKMWREEQILDRKRRGFAISFCLGKYKFPGTEEEARGQAKIMALIDLVEWKEGRISLEDLFRLHGYTRIERVNTKALAQGKGASIGIK